MSHFFFALHADTGFETSIAFTAAHILFAVSSLIIFPVSDEEGNGPDRSAESRRKKESLCPPFFAYTSTVIVTLRSRPPKAKSAKERRIAQFAP